MLRSFPALAFALLLALPGSASAVEFEYECQYEGVVEGENPLQIRVSKVDLARGGQCAEIGDSVTVGKGTGWAERIAVTYDLGSTSPELGDTVQLRWNCYTSSWVPDSQKWTVVSVQRRYPPLPIGLIAAGLFAALAWGMRRKARRPLVQ